MPKARGGYHCFFCGSRYDLMPCRRVAARFEVAYYSDVMVGSRLRRYSDAAGKKPVATVTAVRRMDSERLGINFTWKTLSGAVKGRAICAMVYSRVRIERPGPCERMCCPAHRCERGENHAYCADHWGLDTFNEIGLLIGGENAGSDCSLPR